MWSLLGQLLEENRFIMGRGIYQKDIETMPRLGIAEAQSVRVSGYLSEFLGSFGFWTTVWATSEK